MSFTPGAQLMARQGVLRSENKEDKGDLNATFGLFFKNSRNEGVELCGSQPFMAWAKMLMGSRSSRVRVLKTVGELCWLRQRMRLGTA
jgi:hypothetical protein